MTKPILWIDDLDGASDRDLKAAMDSLQLKKRIMLQLQKQGKKVSPTLADYNKLLLELAEEIECPHCEGTGWFHRPKPREVGCIHPSSASGCRYRLYLDVTGELEARDYHKPELQITFRIGHAIHAQLQDALAKAMKPGEYFSDEARVDMGLVRGNTDGDIETDLAGAILEIKTDGPSSFPTRKGPDPKHRLQAGALYATGLGRPFIVYLYVSKVWPHPIKEYVEIYDARLFRRWWKTKGSHVQRAVDGGPSVLADAKASECRGCPYGYAGGCTQNIGRSKARRFSHNKGRP